MAEAVPMVEVLRGGRRELLHRGHAVICDASGQVVAAWGDPGLLIYPRSSSKMLQALPLVESGAAKAAGLGPEQLALACASHIGALIHTERVERWLAAIGRTEADLRCGSHQPLAIADRFRLHDAGLEPCQIHNNCSGKHSGFLTLSAHIGGGPEYVDPSHPVQLAVKQAFEEMTGEDTPGFGIDGCSAPNFATTLTGFARAMARMARPQGLGPAREAAATALVQAMIAHPLLVAGVGEVDSDLMPAMQGVATKGGADGVHAAILPELGLGVALKIEDGTAQARNAAITAILVRLGAMNPAHPVARARMHGPLLNCRGIETGWIKVADSLQ